MALTGRFNFRKTLTGRIILQVEEEVPGFWSRLRGKTKLHRRWRDASMMDLAAPELRALVDLRFHPRYTPQTYEPAPDSLKAVKQIEATPMQPFRYDGYPDENRFSTH